MERDWITPRLNAIGKNKVQLAKALGFAPPRINEIIKGEREVKLAEAVLMAEFLEMSVLEIIASIFPDMQSITVGSEGPAAFSDFDRALYEDSLRWVLRSLVAEKLPDLRDHDLPALVKVCGVTYDDLKKAKIKEDERDAIIAAAAASNVVRLFGK